MQIFYSSKFEKEYKTLPKRAKFMAVEKEKNFRRNPFNDQLNTHKLKGKLKNYWSFSIDLHYRIIFEFAENGVVWFHSVGTHSIYN